MLGAGTAESPYLVSTPKDFDNFLNLSAHYELTNDITMTSTSFPIGDMLNYKFRGVLDGKGFKIINLKVHTGNSPGERYFYSGLFTCLNGAVVRDLGFINPTITSDKGDVGVLAAIRNENSIIERVYVQGGSLSGTGATTAGGLLASASNMTITDCYARTTFKGSPTLVNTFGGLIGYSLTGNSIKNSYASCTIDPAKSNKNDTKTGAIIGYIEPAEIVSDRFSGLYYNSDTINKNVLPNSVPLTTAQMSDPANFPDFDKSVWGFNEYPFLLEKLDTAPPKVETVAIQSHSKAISASVVGGKIKNVSVTSHASHIGASVIKKGINVIKGTTVVESVMKPLTTSIKVSKNKNFYVISHVDDVGGSVEVTSYRAYRHTYATTSYIVNPSYTEVIE